MKTYKRLIMLFLVLAMSFLCACGSSEAPVSTVQDGNEATVNAAEENKDAPDANAAEAPSAAAPQAEAAPVEAFDLDLAGVWRHVESTENGEYTLGYSLDDLCILPDGTFFYDDREAYDSGAKATIRGNEICGLIEAAWQADVDAGHVAADDPAPELTVTYELSDIQEPSHEDSVTAEFYKKFGNDKLVLKITGTYQVSPVEVQTIDATITYEKNYPTFGSNIYLEGYLLGNWSDSLGNHWEFYYTDDAEPELQFSMTDANGKTHAGDSMSRLNNLDEAYEYLTFYFDDFDMKDYIIVSFDNNTFTFDNKGNEFCLYREA